MANDPTTMFYNTSIGFLEESDFDKGSSECSDEKDADNSGNGQMLKYSKMNPEKVYMTMVFASWCGPCKMAKPHYRNLSQLLDKHNISDVRLTAIDASDDPSLGNSICVKGYPTFLLWKNGKKKKYSGNRDSRSFIKALSDHSSQIKEKLEVLEKDATVKDALT